MELNSKITFYPNGSYEILIEEGKDSGFFIGVSMEELKEMATAYAESSKKRKEVLKKEVEASKKIGKKAIVKAFLKKAIEKKRKGSLKSLIEESEHNPSIYSDDHADDEDPHPSDYSELVKQLEEGKKTAKMKKGWFYVYGGNGSGRLNSGLLLLELAKKSDAPFVIDYERDVFDYSGKKLKSWLKSNFDSAETMEDDFEPTQMGDFTIKIKVKDDEQRKKAIAWFKSLEDALEKVIF